VVHWRISQRQRKIEGLKKKTCPTATHEKLCGMPWDCFMPSVLTWTCIMFKKWCKSTSLKTFCNRLNLWATITLNSNYCCSMGSLTDRAVDPCTVLSIRELRARVQMWLWSATWGQSGRCVTNSCCDEFDWHCLERVLFLSESEARIEGLVWPLGGRVSKGNEA
jgi:hypothetical protein